MEVASLPWKLKPLTCITCGLITVGLLLPLLVALPVTKPFRKEIIGLSCVLLFVGTLARVRLERCRMELLQTVKNLGCLASFAWLCSKNLVGRFKD